jgi:hypothetical protein
MSFFFVESVTRAMKESPAKARVGSPITANRAVTLNASFGVRGERFAKLLRGGAI